MFYENIPSSPIRSKDGTAITELIFCSGDISKSLCEFSKRVGSEEENGYKNIYVCPVMCKVREELILFNDELQIRVYQELLDNKYGYSSQEIQYLPERLLKAASMNLSNFQLINESGELCSYIPKRDKRGNYEVLCTKYTGSYCPDDYSQKTLTISVNYELINVENATIFA
jgi:hypothetical protein